jgi:hypothetical protein
MPDLPIQSDASQPEWEKHGFASEAEMNLELYKITKQQSEERFKRRQELYEMGFLSTDQFYNNR